MFTFAFGSLLPLAVSPLGWRRGPERPDELEGAMVLVVDLLELKAALAVAVNGSSSIRVGIETGVSRTLRFPSDASNLEHGMKSARATLQVVAEAIGRPLVEIELVGVALGKIEGVIESGWTEEVGSEYGIAARAALGYDRSAQRFR